MTHDEIAELLGAYALDATSPEETAQIEQHLAECPRCRSEVAAHREVAGVLGNLGGTAPAELWGRIAGELAIGSGGPSAVPETPLLGSPAPVVAIESTRRRRRAAPGPAADGGRRRRTAVLMAVAALAAALAIVVGVLSSKVLSLDNRVTALSNGILAGGVKAQVAAAENVPGSVTVDLSADGARWSAKVVAVPGGQAFLLPGVMPAIGSDRTFQAWAEVGGKFVSLGVLGRSPGDVALQLQPGMTAILVNTEPQGGSPQPTTKPFLSGAVPATLQ